MLEPGEAAAVVAAAGLGLALAPPARPMEAEALLRRRAQQEGEQAPDRRDGQRAEAGGRAPPSAPALAAVRVTARKAWASRQRVTWRCHPAQERTSY